MIDIHCHILPNMDDGAQSMVEALEMARLAVDSGVTDIIATPHFPADMLQQGLPQQMLQTLEQFRHVLRNAGIPLQIHPGAEILCLPDAAALGHRSQLPTLGQGQYLLAEFFFNESLTYMNNTLRNLAALGYTPIVAHPERYHAVQENIRIVEEWFRQGYLIQVNKGSVLGAFGEAVRLAAQHLLFHGLVHILASDAHHADHRTPHMQQLHHWALEHLGTQYTHVLLQENPRRVLRGEPPVPVE